MELLGFIFAFGIGWVLGYYDIPNLHLSQQDELDDRDEGAALRAYRASRHVSPQSDSPNERPEA